MAAKKAPPATKKAPPAKKVAAKRSSAPPAKSPAKAAAKTLSKAPVKAAPLKTSSPAKPAKGSAKTPEPAKKAKPEVKESGLVARDRDLLRSLDASYANKTTSSVAVILNEARELGATLAGVGPDFFPRADLDKDVAAELQARTARLTAAENSWLIVRKVAAPKEIVTLRLTGDLLRNDAYAALRYFARGEPDAQHALDVIGEGSGDADLIDDLQKLAELLNKYSALLKKAELPKTPVLALRQAAKSLADAVAERAVDTDTADTVLLRNRAFWHLRELMDTIRAAGRYVYRADEPRLKLFRGHSTRKRHSSSAPKVVTNKA